MFRPPPPHWSYPNVSPLIAGVDGWTPLLTKPTYSGADTPTFTLICNGDLTDLIGLGMRLRLIQAGTTKYFIVTKLAFASGMTTISIYGGTDYTLTTSDIYFPCFSGYYAPVGFPLDTSKWTVLISSTSDFTQSSPVSGIWYNLGSLQISIPIGSWEVGHSAMIECIRTANTSTDVIVDFSTSSTAQTLAEAASRSINVMASQTMTFRYWVIRYFEYAVTAKTTLFFIASSSVSPTSISLRGVQSATILRATSRYI